jgi:hypothetical protein
MNGLAYLASATLLLAWNPIAPPQIPAPEKANRITAPIVIKHGAIKGEGPGIQAKLIIPKGLVHGAAPPRAGSAPAPAVERQSSLQSLRTVIAGIAMSLAAVSVVFIVRGNRNGRTVALAMLVGAMVLGAYGVASADIPDRPERPQIVIELVDGGDSVTLLLAK